MRCSVIALLLLALAGCTAVPVAEIVTLGDGTVLEIEPGVDVEREETSGRIALRGGDGLVVTLQEIAVEERGVETRTPRDVAAAMAERIELHEREGELGHHPCQVGGRPAQCLVGWMEREGARYSRNGAILRVGSRIVWVDVAGPESRVAAVNERSRSVLASVRVRGT